MLGVSDLLLAGVLPAAAALVARQGALRLGRGDALAWGLAVAIGFTAGFVGLAAQGGAADAADWLRRLPSAAALVVRPREASHWLPLLAVGSVVVALLAGGGRGLRTAAAVCAPLLAVAIPARLLWGSVYTATRWSGGESVAYTLGLGLSLLAAGWLVTRPAAPTTRCGAGRSLARLTLLLAVCTGLAVVLATSGSLSYARLAVALAASVAGAACGGLGVRPLGGLADGAGAAGPVIATLFGGLLLLGAFFAEVTASNAALLATAGVAAAAVRGPAIGRHAAAIALRAALCLAPLGIATGGAVLAFREATTQQQANPYAGWKSP